MIIEVAAVINRYPHHLAYFLKNNMPEEIVARIDVAENVR